MPETRRRLVADRFRRVWAVAEEIAARPGQSRRELADTFHLSERQLQADLLIIQREMRLPLVRRQGYRFTDEGVPVRGSACTFRDAVLLALIFRVAARQRTFSPELLTDLAGRLGSVFPPHLAPLATRLLASVTAPQDARLHVLTALADALMRGASVRLSLHQRSRLSPESLGEQPAVRPEILVPYLGRWHLLAHAPGVRRTVMIDLDGIAAVTVAAGIDS